MLAKGSHHLHRWQCGIPSNTPAVQAGLFYGDRDNVPGYRWFDRKEQRVRVVSDPADLREILGEQGIASTDVSAAGERSTVLVGVGALRAGFETAHALVDRVFDEPIVTELEMEHVVPVGCAPIATVESIATEDVEGAADQPAEDPPRLRLELERARHVQAVLERADQRRAHERVVTLLDAVADVAHAELLYRRHDGFQSISSGITPSSSARVRVWSLIWSMTVLAKLLQLRHTFCSQSSENGRGYAWQEEGDHGHSRDVETLAAGSE